MPTLFLRLGTREHLWMPTRTNMLLARVQWVMKLALLMDAYVLSTFFLPLSISFDVSSCPSVQCQSPAPSQARSHRHSMSKTTSGENVRVSMTVDTIKQQLNDGLQMLAEFKKSLRASSDVQRYDEAMGNFEGAARGLATLKSKLSSRKLAGNPSRNSYVLPPPPDLKVEFEDTPFSMGIPGIEESQKETTLDVVQENKENEAQEEKNEKGQQQQHTVWV